MTFVLDTTFVEGEALVGIALKLSASGQSVTGGGQ